MKQFLSKKVERSRKDVNAYICPEQCSTSCTGYCADGCQGNCGRECSGSCGTECKVGVLFN